MKKTAWIVFPAIIASLLVTAMTIAGTSPWLRGYPDDDNVIERYELTNLTGEHCSVSLLTDGRLRAYACAENETKLDEQEALINPAAGTGSIIERSYVKSGRHLLKFEGGGYSVFYVHCKDAAKELPAEVRAKFLGYFGIE